MKQLLLVYLSRQPEKTTISCRQDRIAWWSKTNRLLPLLINSNLWLVKIQKHCWVLQITPWLWTWTNSRKRIKKPQVQEIEKLHECQNPWLRNNSKTSKLKKEASLKEVSTIFRGWTIMDTKCKDKRKDSLENLKHYIGYLDTPLEKVKKSQMISPRRVLFENQLILLFYWTNLGISRQ